MIMNKGFSKIIFPELSYKINGILFEVHNNLGRHCNEQQYADAVEELLKRNDIKYEVGIMKKFIKKQANL